jgi:purine catabolism regulator
MDFVAIESAASNIALALVKEKAINEIEYRFKNDIIDDIIYNRYSAESEIENRANTVGWDLSLPHVVLLVQMPQFEKDIFQNLNILRRKESIGRVLMVINSTAYHYAKNMIIISKSDHFIILFPTLEVQSETIKRFSNELYQNIANQIGELSTIIGVGTDAKSISEIRRSYFEAVDAINFGRMLQGNNDVIFYNELGVYRLLCQFSEKEALIKFVHPALIKLHNYDSEKNNELIKTLDIYLGYNSNANKTACDLFIHYKTVQYRINRIKEIMEIDFEDKKYKLEIDMGLKILDILNLKK